MRFLINFYLKTLLTKYVEINSFMYWNYFCFMTNFYTLKSTELFALFDMICIKLNEIQLTPLYLTVIFIIIIYLNLNLFQQNNN
jgi:hypothetical protein